MESQNLTRKTQLSSFFLTLGESLHIGPQTAAVLVPAGEAYMGVRAVFTPAGDRDVPPADGYGLGDLDFHLGSLLSKFLWKRKQRSFSHWEKRRFSLSFYMVMDIVDGF